MGDTKNTVKEQDFQVIDGGKGADNKDTIKINKLKVFKSELVNVEYLNADDLFSEFDSIKVITFSYDINFMDHLMQFFKYGEIILGADYMAQKDGKLNDLLEVAANNYEAIQAVKSKKHLVEMIAKGDLNLRTSNYILDHRKIYLLKSDDGRTRVIKASANMSGRAWNGEHMEHYEYDDTPFCYEEYEKDFETAWLMASDVPYTMISGKKSEDYIEGNPMIKRAKETDKVTVVQTSSEPVNLEIVKYMIDHTRIKEDYKEIFNGCGAQNKGGVIELKPKVIKKVEMGLKKLNNKRRISVSVQKRFYPELTFDWNEQKAFMDGTELDLHPSVEDVRKDIDELMQVFQNFEMFVDETGDLQATHFKFMNFIFESPFHAKLRFDMFLRGIGTMSLPMFALETSETANSGKTFMTNFILKMINFHTANLRPTKSLGVREPRVWLSETKRKTPECSGVSFFRAGNSNSLTNAFHICVYVHLCVVPRYIASQHPWKQSQSLLQNTKETTAGHFRRSVFLLSGRIPGVHELLWKAASLSCGRYR